MQASRIECSTARSGRAVHSAAWPLQACRPIARQYAVHLPVERRRPFSLGAQTAAEGPSASASAVALAVKGSAGSAAVQQASPRGKRQPRVPLSDEAMEVLARHSELPGATLERIRQYSIKAKALSSDTSVLLERIAALKQLLGASNAEVLLHANPRILCARPESLAANVEAWQAMLPNLPREGLLRMLGAAGRLITRNPQKANIRMMETAAVLNITEQDRVEWMMHNISLQSVSTSCVKRKLAAVAEVFNSIMGGTDGTNMLHHVQEAAQRSNARWLGASEGALRQRVQGLHELIVPLAAAVGMEARTASFSIFKKAPNVLTIPTEALAEHVTLFMELPGLGRVRAAAILLDTPSLLARNPAVIASRWTAICTAANSHEIWAQQLGKYASSTVATLLIKGENRYARLAWVMHSGQQASMALSCVLMLNATQFARRFPEYQS